MDENKINPTPIDESEDRIPDEAETQKIDLNKEADEIFAELHGQEQSEAEAEAVETEAAETEAAEEAAETEAAETEAAEEAAETETAEAEAVEENEFEKFMAENNEENSEGTQEVTEAAEGENLQQEPYEAAAQMPVKKKKSKGAVAILVVMVLILITAIGCIVGMIFKSAMSSKVDYNETALTIGETELTVGEYIYWYTYVDVYYQNYYSYYYSSISPEQIQADAVNQMTYITALYKEAKDAGYVLDEEDIAEIDSNMDNYVQAAEVSSMDVDEYIAENYGDGYNAEMLRGFLEKQALAYKYYEEMITSIEDGFKGEDAAGKVEAAYLEQKATYDLSDVSYWYFDSAEENSADNADKLVSQVQSGVAFDEAIKAVTGDSEAISNKLAGYDSSTISSQFSEDAAAWIFETDENGDYVNASGSVTQIESSGVIYVLYVNDAPHRNEVIPVTLEVIEVSVSEDSSVKSEDELRLQAKSKANDILAQFEETDKSYDSFIEIADSYADGSEELVAADIYDSMINDGTYDSSVEAWAFDEARKEGDYALIEGDGTYYIVFLAQIAENSVWYESVYNSLLTEAIGEWEQSVISEYEKSVVKNNQAIESAMAYINEMRSAY